MLLRVGVSARRRYQVGETGQVFFVVMHGDIGQGVAFTVLIGRAIVGAGAIGIGVAHARDTTVPKPVRQQNSKVLLALSTIGGIQDRRQCACRLAGVMRRRSAEQRRLRDAFKIFTYVLKP